MAKPSFQEQISQLLSAYLQQEKPSRHTVAGFAAFLAPPTNTPEGNDQ